MKKGSKKPVPASPELKPLSDKEKAFVEAYMRSHNKKLAAVEAGYGLSTDGAARTAGWEVYNRPHVKAAIDQRFEEIRQETNAIWARMSDFSRCSMEYFIKIVPLRNQKGEPVIGEDGAPVTIPELDIEKAQKLGMLHLIKKLTPTRHGYAIELVDPLKANETIAKMVGILEPERDRGGEVKKNPFDEYMEAALARLRQQAKEK